MIMQHPVFDGQGCNNNSHTHHHMITTSSSAPDISDERLANVMSPSYLAVVTTAEDVPQTLQSKSPLPTAPMALTSVVSLRARLDPDNDPDATTDDTSCPALEESDREEDDISVGCPSPQIPTNLHRHYSSSFHHNRRIDNEYFKPLKKLKMVNSDSSDEHQDDSQSRDEDARIEGVKSFSIADILNHKPIKLSTATPTVPGRIVRPWDIERSTAAMVLDHHQSQVQQPFHHHLAQHHSQHPFKMHQQLALLRPDLMAAAACFSNAVSAAAAAAAASNYASETGSDRSSSVASGDCCSPDLLASASGHQTHLSRSHHNQQTRTKQHQPGATPLDALFQMTSKTFDANSAEGSNDPQSHLNLFNSRQQPKKKRKSRTAFTNHQIFELEKRFLYQKYLSPADRDEIASSLGLTNAQVITWFQNRRAKLKRDMEELKKDVESAKLLTAHKSFLENVQDLGILKKKSNVGIPLSDEDCPKNLVISADK